MAQETMHEFHHTDADTASHHPIAYITLWICGIILWVVGDSAKFMDIGQAIQVFLEIIFKLLSIVSVVFIIAKNYKGGMENIKSIFTGKKSKKH